MNIPKKSISKQINKSIALRINSYIILVINRQYEVKKL